MIDHIDRLVEHDLALAAADIILTDPERGWRRLTRGDLDRMARVLKRYANAANHDPGDEDRT